MTPILAASVAAYGALRYALMACHLVLALVLQTVRAASGWLAARSILSPWLCAFDMQALSISHTR
jgi:hypothetical protein